MTKNKLPYLLPVRSVMFALVFIIGAAAVNRDLSSISNWWSPAATVLNIVTILLLIFTAKKCGLTYAQLINYRRGQSGAKRMVAIIAITLIVGTAGMYIAGYICYGVIPYSAPMMIVPIPKALAVIIVLLLPVTTALAEDGLYLGCGAGRIQNKYAAVLVPAFFFALQHCFIPTLFDVRYIVYRFLSFLPLALILCWHYRKHRDPLPIMIGHALIDVATVVLITVTSFVPGFYEKMCSM